MSQLTIQQAFELAVRHHQAGQLQQAERIYRQILAQQPGNADALHLLGVVAQQNGRANLAVDLLRQALARNPHIPDAYSNLGAALQDLGQLDEAIAACRQAIALNPRLPEAYSNLGNALHARGQLDAAIAACRQAIALKPDYPTAYSNLGNILRDKGQFDAALAACRQAIALKPDYPKPYNNLGNALHAQGQLDAAVAAYRQALALKPHYSEAYSNLATALKDQGQLDEAIIAYRQAVALAPNDFRLHSNLAYILYFHPDYDAPAIYQEACRWNAQHARQLAPANQTWPNERAPDRPLRIGYMSPNFRAHTNGWAMLPLLQAHDRAHYRIICYSDVTSPDTMTEKCQKAADEWRPIAGLSDERVAELVRHDRIDILVDLVSHMAYNRLLVFARQAAPVQTTYLCNQGTTGMSAMDYRISDPHVDPPGTCDGCYTEKTLYVPDCYLCFQAPPDSPAVNALPAVQNGYVTFGSMNNFAKVTPQVVECWGRLLAALPASQLILRCPAGETQRRVREAFARHGVPAARLSLHAERFAGAAYLQLHQRMDICLDPFPYAGHTTSLDALWMGVPLVTLAGHTAAARGGVFLLANLGLPELIAHDEREYLDKALALAQDLPRLKEIRSTLRRRLEQSPLMDAPRLARNIEAAYRQMWRQWCATAR